MKYIFDDVSGSCSKVTTLAYSSSFSIGIKMLAAKFHDPVYAIYGFVRFADEIVDSFHDYPKAELLAKFREDTYLALEHGISLNPILNSFQHAVQKYHIEIELIDTFLDSMEMDLNMQDHSKASYDKYILGSAQVVGLMCLRVFTDGDRDAYEHLKPYAISLGAAFQKVNFLRDMCYDKMHLGRVYFPGLDFHSFTEEAKAAIQQDIEADFTHALIGIKQLPTAARLGVYTSYIYYRKLFKKIKGMSPAGVVEKRIRIPDYQKMNLLAFCFIKNSLRII
ncbi:phytoene/squalene synthase family protein [Dyadobacter sp. MSC1_007]|jgi:phytoene synthase|uniref:phytoene/squalene synthase family protein n=1 Tax=Dyadobacter sp. MSC1_007 TaxID=2909264 RepID=UPI002030353D|nr:phytoene/squalene synthase family protein [Dyadobacter sp. MSC1_007]